MILNKIKVLIVDDSSLIRQTFKSLLESDPGIEVIGTASDPYIAVQKIQQVKPDVITLDIEMPKMDGLTFLKKIMKQAPMPVVVISNQTIKGAEVALKALEYGAVNVLSKPRIATEIQREEYRIKFIDSLKSAFFARNPKVKIPITKKVKDPVLATPKKEIAQREVSEEIISEGKPSLIVIGASTGGTVAIKKIVEDLPDQVPPILIVQHMPEKFTTSFANSLNECSGLYVKEAEHNELIQPNTIYIAPGNYHMSIWKSGSKKRIKISQGDLVNRHRPSVNVLFDSVAQYVGKKALGIMLTGMGDDGATSMLKMKQSGAQTIAQDESSCVVFGMPRKAIELGAVRQVLPLDKIAGVINKRLLG
ncbi:protein-glutamate methylesterase/protein-glutamine glutaminase [Flexithrix dorotheae]|uniref:protein-glutamate methylesterase/protein-glutamine glutaminase n=1 Tax=Flexithrix dorotheae TaxID=70993 RepID=UPI00036AE08D|nr:chemotaxis response regulator protein-glutamate methylesterase [Flexithrix dorotheae]